MKILIMPEGLNWVVDRNCQSLISSLPDIEFTVKPYFKTNPIDFIREANEHDLVHYFNWDVRRIGDVWDYIRVPVLVSVRSHRFTRKAKDTIYNYKMAVHVVNRDLLKDFPGATYIPNGIFDQFKGNGFTVGYAGHPAEQFKEYDGYHLIKRACEEMGVTFKPALNLLPEEMPDYYRSINLYICASVAEGFSTGVMECLAMNVPVISVDSGEARHFVPYTIERSVDGIKRGIQKYYTQDLVSEYRWDKLAPAYREMYLKILGGHNEIPL